MNTTQQETGLVVYWPEMGDTKPVAQIEARISYVSGKWLLKTSLELKGRGITFQGKMKAEHLVESAKHKAGWNEYHVTAAAFEKLKTQYRISSEALLS